MGTGQGRRPRSQENQAVLFLRSTITPRTRAPRAAATTRIIRLEAIAILLSRHTPSIQGRSAAGQNQADLLLLLRMMMKPTTTTARVSATMRTIKDEGIAVLLSGGSASAGHASSTWKFHSRPQCRLVVRVMTAGASSTMNRQGKIKNTSGNRILTLVLAAASSARCRRDCRISSE